MIVWVRREVCSSGRVVEGRVSGTMKLHLHVFLLEFCPVDLSQPLNPASCNFTAALHTDDQAPPAAEVSTYRQSKQGAEAEPVHARAAGVQQNRMQSYMHTKCSTAALMENR